MLIGRKKYTVICWNSGLDHHPVTASSIVTVPCPDAYDQRCDPQYLTSIQIILNPVKLRSISVARNARANRTATAKQSSSWECALGPDSSVLDAQMLQKV